MKSFIFMNILLIILLSQYECLNVCAGTGTSKSDCNSRDLSEGQYRCCYYYYKYADASYKECIGISKSSYKDFKNFVKYYKEKHKDADAFSFDCNSNYLISSMFWLFLLLF